MEAYFSALEQEIRAKGREMGATLNHIYVGGGTPSIAYEYFPLLKRAIDKYFFIADDVEISMECNPESVTPEFVAAAKSFGVNRISVGIQSLSDRLLRRIGRAHDGRTALAALDLLTKSFPAVNADVMVGLPDQTIADVKETLNALLGYPLRHLSCYSLILEEGTALYAAAERGEFVPNDDFSVELYDYARERLAEEGFRRYEISNFCKGDAVCGYNTSVWQYGEYLGVGLGASSFLREGEIDFAVRLKNTADMGEYISYNGKKGGVLEAISKEEGEREFIMLGLRLEEGLNRRVFCEIFGFDILAKYGEKIKRIGKPLVVTPDHVAISSEYFYISNAIIQEIIY